MKLTPRPLNRGYTPAGPPQAYKTYAARLIHRPASCAEVECPRARNGWRTVLDVGTVKGQKTANYIRLHSGRRFTYTQAGTVVTFTFAAGQRCFGAHQVPAEQDPILKIRGGDWRGDPDRRAPQTLSVRSWLDDFGANQISLAELQKRG